MFKTLLSRSKIFNVKLCESYLIKQITKYGHSFVKKPQSIQEFGSET